MPIRLRKDSEVTKELVDELFEYDSTTGNLLWRWPNGTAEAGDVAGYVRPQGYRYIRINSRDYAAHRLVWLMHHGSFPRNYIDHINNTRADNRIENLRDVTHAENMLNLAPGSGASSGYKGVYTRKGKKGFKYFVVLYWEGDNYNLGTYETPEEASMVYHVAREAFGLSESNVRTM